MDPLELAMDDKLSHGVYGSDLNPFSTYGARQLWQHGWDGVRPENLQDGSGNWRTWERGRLAHYLSGATP